MSSALPDRSMREFHSPRDTSRLSTDIHRNSAPNATLTTTGSPKPSFTKPSSLSPSAKSIRRRATALSRLSKNPSGLPSPCSKTAPTSTSKNGRPRAEMSHLPKTSGTKSSRPSRATKDQSSSSSASPSKGATGLLKLELVSY